MRLFPNIYPLLQKLCEAHGVKRLYAFGSVLTSNFSVGSDVDLIVDFENVNGANYADNYFSLKAALEHAFNRPVDLLEEQALKNPYFKAAIAKSRQLVYEHGN